MDSNFGVFFGVPLALGLLGLPLILLLAHWLLGGARAVPVSSVELWREIGGSAVRPRRKWHLRLDTSLVLALLVLTALALAAGDPWVVRRPTVDSLVVVVDGSLSMWTRDEPDGPSRLDVAREMALATLRSSPETPSRVLLVTGVETGTFAARYGENIRFEEALAELEPGRGEPDLNALARTAADLVRSSGAGRVTVISDFAGEAFTQPVDSERVVWDLVSVGAPADNRAVTSLTVSERGVSGEATLAVATILNASSERSSAEASIEIDQDARLQRKLSLGPSESRDVVFPVPPGAERLVVTVSPGGSLAEDDSLALRLPPPIRFDADPLTLAPEVAVALDVLRRSAPNTRVAAPKVQVISGEMPDPLPPRWIRLATRTSPAQPRRDVVLDVVDPRDFLAGFHPVTINPAALTASPPADASPLAVVAGRPALAIVDRDGSRGVWCGVPLEETDLAQRGLLPVVLFRMLRWIDGAAPLSVSRVESTDLTPRPPSSATSARSARQSHAAASQRLRDPLLWVSALIILVEILRSSRAGRRRSPSAASLHSPPPESIASGASSARRTGR